MREEIIGDCRLVLGDCLEFLPTLEAGSVDALVTDPPYGIFACGGTWGKKSELGWDRQPATGIERLVSVVEWAIVWGGNYFSLPPSRGWLVWYKRDSVPSAADVELAWTNIDMNARLIDQTIAATNSERCGHPTQKPLAVMDFSLSFVPDAKTIFDPFMGSGTTLVAAVGHGKSAIGVECELKYFDIACRRIERAVRDAKCNLFREPAPVKETQSALFGTDA